ncbi:MAG TPA: pilus assembly protein PilP [Gammaproteobacteria bacterium]|nr:pilus assembly protein PilP [Gammaproteobacteria bacterium]
MRLKATPRWLAILGLSLAVAACGSDQRELQAWIDQVKARPGGAIEPLPEILPAPSFAYEPGDRRSPFVPQQPLRAQASTGINPDLDRPREQLEQEPLDALAMVGTLSNANGTFGLVQDSDGLVHRVTVGNFMGQNYGRITNINESEIELVEIIRDGLGGFYERPAAIGLD